MASILGKCISNLRVLTVSRTTNLQTIAGRRTFKRWLSPTLKELYRRKKKMGPQMPDHRNTYLEWNYEAERYAFAKRLNEDFREDLLLRAFTHRSYIIQEEEKQRDVGIEEPKINLEDNRELIEKGERFMSEYINQYVRFLLPTFPEEGVRAVYNYLMGDEILAGVSADIGIKDLILSAEFPVENPTLASTLKAVVAALLDSSGEERAGKFVRDFVVTQLISKDVNDMWQPEDPWQTLSDILSRDGRSLPEPRLIGNAGCNTILATYHIGIYVDKEFLGAGFGESVEEAKQMAALDILKHFFNTTDSMAPFSFTADIHTKDKAPAKANVSIDQWSLRNVVHLK